MYQDYNNFYQELDSLIDVDITQLNTIKPPLFQISAQPNELLLSTSFYPDSNIGFIPYYDYPVSSPSTSGSSCSSSPNIENMYEYYSLDMASMPLLHQPTTTTTTSTTTTTTDAATDIDTTTSRSDDMIRPLKKRPNKTFACPICKRLFARKHDLQRHIRVHTGDKPYSCINCKKSFARTDALKRHLRMEDTCRTSPVIQALKSTGSRRYRNL